MIAPQTGKGLWNRVKPSVKSWRGCLRGRKSLLVQLNHNSKENSPLRNKSNHADATYECRGPVSRRDMPLLFSLIFLFQFLHSHADKTNKTHGTSNPRDTSRQEQWKHYQPQENRPMTRLRFRNGITVSLSKNQKSCESSNSPLLKSFVDRYKREQSEKDLQRQKKK